MMQADLLIYASPVYVFGMSSLLKRLIERFHCRAPIDEIILTPSGLFFHATDRSLTENDLSRWSCATTSKI